MREINNLGFKKIFVLLLVLFSLVSCGNNGKEVKNIKKTVETKILYSTTDFTNIGNKDSFNDHFNSKQAKGSNVYEINFKNRKDYTRKLITSSDKKIVYHDYCKLGNKVYAVGGEFGENRGTSRLVQVFPKIENKKIYTDNEIRFRDCETIKQDGKTYVLLVSHGDAEILLYDIENKKLVDKKKVSYTGEINGKKYEDITMIHEIVKADLNGGGKEEFYFTLTSKNGETNIDQRGKIYKAEIKDNKLEISEFYDLKEAYAKEIHKLQLKNNKEILLVSIQGKTEINKEKDKNTKPKMILKFKSGKTITKKNLSKITDIIRPVELKALYLEDNKLKEKSLTKVKTATQCRTIENGNFFEEKDKVDFILGCNRGAIKFFTLDNNLNITLKKQLRIPEKQIHSFYAVDTNGDGRDEAFVGVDFDGLYHLDLNEPKGKELFKLYDYSKTETWIWWIVGIK